MNILYYDFKCFGWCPSYFTVFKAPAKRSQHANATYRYTVGRNMLREFGCRWLKFDHFQTRANNTQQCCNMLR